MNSTLRRFLIAIFLASSISVFSQKDFEPEFISLFNTSMQEGVSCYRIPALVTAKNGDLVAAIDERVPHCGDLKYSNDINIVFRRSTDHGKTWLPIERAIDFPLGESASDPSLIVNKETGEIFMFYNYMNLTTEKDIFYLHFCKSSDNGKTWSEPVDISSQIAKPEWKKDFKFITSGRGVRTKSGKLLHTLVNLKYGVFVFGSDDNGKSWYVLDTPVNPADESKIIELADGKWMINSRVNGAGFRYSHVSADEGKTWTSKAEKELVDPSCNAAIMNVEYKRKNYLVFSNANSAKERENLTLKISADQGKTWSEGFVLYAGPTAYSTITLTKKNEIGIFFEKDNYKDNSFVKIPFKLLLKKLVK